MNCPINFYISRDELGELKSLINTITNSKARRNRKQAILRLRRSQNKILEYIGQNQSVSPSDLSDRFSYSSRGLLNYSNAKRYLRELSQLKLIEIDRQRISETENNKKRYYKLSGAGIYYLISKNKNLVHGILKNIIIYNHNHILFKLFLYVCIEYDTLYAITDTSVFLRVCEYLHNCCKDIEHMFEYIDKTYNSRNGYLIDQIFVWNNIPRMDYDTNALRDFLKQKFSFDWLGKSTVEKTGDGNGIRITVGLKTMLLSLNKEKTKAVLSYRGKKIYEFIVNQLPSTTSGTSNQETLLVVYTDEYLWPPMMTFVKRPLVEVYLENFRISLQVHMIMLVFSLSLNYRAKSPAIEILAKDRRFLKQLEMTRNHFENWCSFFGP